MPIDTLLSKANYLSEDDLAVIQQAYVIASAAHEGQSRLSGEPYIEHPLAVACLLADLHLDRDTLAAALLHDTVEDTEISREDLVKLFGEDVARLVDGVTKLGKIHVQTQEEAQAENIRKMLVAMAQDIRVVLIKLADRLHNMRTITFHNVERRLRISRETLDIYAPLAHRLGIWQFKWELEDLAFAQLDPENFALMEQRLASQRVERETFIRDVKEILERELGAAHITGEISGRSKHLYSIYEKMRKHQKEFDEIYDVIAIRVLVDTIKDCYGVLGLVHSLWKPIPGRFKDYIAVPKGNGYQSLHTTVVSHTGTPMEIQIRTFEMHHLAEYGVAAHWRYKDTGIPSGKLEDKYSWLKLLSDWQKEVSDAKSFVDAVKVDIFQDEVFVFTPRGDVRSLSQGSTPIDFAYRVHTDVGHHCIGAKVNGRMVSLDYRLQNGDIVEILTSKNSRGPSRDWLSFVKTSSAKEKIRSYFKRERREENVQRGRELLEKELRRVHQMALNSIKEERWRQLLKEYPYSTVDDFLAAIGYGEVSARGVVLRFNSLDALDHGHDGVDDFGIPLTSSSAPTGEVMVLGQGNMLTSLAKCCHPVAGDPIKGYVTRGKGVTVHRATCSNIRNTKDHERIVEVDWVRGNRDVYPVTVKIEAWDRTGLLRDIATVIAESKINVLDADIQVYDDKTAVISTIVEIHDLSQLSRLLEKLESIRDVHTVSRQIA
ncbi:MAG: RelA/SpoT family protein [Candidatus Dormibacteria bacterium]